MPARFRLSVHRKNEYRKAQRRSVTVQPISIEFRSPFTNSQPVQSTSPTQPEVLMVSIPRCVLQRYDVASVMILRERIGTLAALPTGKSNLEPGQTQRGKNCPSISAIHLTPSCIGWVDANAGGGLLVLSKVQRVDEIPQVSTPVLFYIAKSLLGFRSGTVLRLPPTSDGFCPLERGLSSQLVDPCPLCLKHSHQFLTC
jgi:hypothetical protein